MQNKSYTKKFYIFFVVIILILVVFIINLKNKSNNNKTNDLELLKTASTKSIIENNLNEENDVSKQNTLNNEIEGTDKLQENNILSYYKGYPVIAKLEIPSIDLITDVLSDYSEENLKISVTKFYKGKPNQVGNFCIVGHNYITSNMFHNLNKLEVNEKIYLTDKLYGKKEYYIYKKEIVNPKDVSCLSQETDGNMELTLITCTADSKKRIIIKAREL